jgi:hypothetical protein
MWAIPLAPPPLSDKPIRGGSGCCAAALNGTANKIWRKINSRRMCVTKGFMVTKRFMSQFPEVQMYVSANRLSDISELSDICRIPLFS